MKNKIKELRKEKNLKQKDLAKLLNLDASSISKYESNVATPSPDILLKLSELFNVSTDYLLGNTETKKEPFDMKKDPNFLGNYNTSNLKKIPLLGHISAGLPMYAEEHLEGYIYTDLNGGANYFALRIKGDSMNAARICDGDIVIVRIQNVVENGEIAVVMVGGENATVKRFYKNNNIITLSPQSFNPTHQIQQYDLKNTNIKILGKVVKVEIEL